MAKGLDQILSIGLPAFLDVSGEREGGTAAPGQPVEDTVLHYSCHAGFLLEGFKISLYQAGQMGLT